MKNIFVLFVIFFFSSAVVAEEQIKVEPVKPETSERDINIRLFFNAPIENITINHYHDGKKVGDDIDYDANTAMNVGVAASYKFIGASVSRSNGSLEDENKFGKTKSNDIQFYIYMDQFGTDLYYQKYKGMYLSNPTKFGYQEGDPETLRSDIAVRNFGANVYYALFKEFSLAAAFKQMETSYTSGGSPLVSFSVNRFTIKGDSSLIPLAVQTEYGEFSDFRGGSYTNASIGGGYGYLKAFKNGFYAAAALMVGIGYMRSAEDLGTSTLTANGTAINVNLKFSAGYNRERYYFGFTGFGFANGTSKNSKEYTNISCIGGLVEFFGGMRF